MKTTIIVSHVQKICVYFVYDFVNSKGWHLVQSQVPHSSFRIKEAYSYG